MIKDFLLYSLLSLIIVSCGTNDNVDVEKFDVTGTSEDLEDGRAPIDPAINDGRFDMTWRVDDNGAISYTARFYLSANSNLDESNDVLFHFVYCDEFVSCDHDKRNDEECHFSNDLTIYCGDEDNATEYDVDDVVDSLPMDAYIIIKACAAFDCDTREYPVRLQ